MLVRIQWIRQQRLGCTILAGDELAAAAEARVSSGGGCRAHGKDLVVATAPGEVRRMTTRAGAAGSGSGHGGAMAGDTELSARVARLARGGD